MSQRKLTLNATWSMAVGGMIGGGIFSVLGLVIATAGPWASVSFLIGGLIALATGYSYASLADQLGEGGGAFTFLRESRHQTLAGSLSWVLIIGYVMTISVYAFTFGHYLREAFELGPLFARLASAAIIILLVGVNLRGVGQASWLEIITVWGKLIILMGLAGFGLFHLSPGALTYESADPGGWWGAVAGAAVVFMAYEGFQLISYDYDDIEQPRKTVPRAILLGIAAVIVVYITVTLGATALAGSEQIVRFKEIALAKAGAAALGSPGRIIVSVAAVLSTMSAINATLFATARLVHYIAEDHELPAWTGYTNARGVPDRAVIVLGGGALLLAVIGGLGDLVEAASLAFLLTFATVNFLAARQVRRHRWIAWLGFGGAVAAAAVLAVRLGSTKPLVLATLAAFVGFAVLARLFFLRPGKKESA